MAELELVPLVVSSVLTGGLAGALASGLLAGWRESQADKRLESRQESERRHTATMQREELEHTAQMQREEREHEARLRAEAAHDAAREEHMRLASDVRNWIAFQWNHFHGEEHAVFNIVTKLPPDVSSPSEVVACLTTMRDVHPTRRVRRLADTLRGNMVNYFNDATNYVPGSNAKLVGPDYAQFERWAGLADDLHDAVVGPPDFADD